MSVATTSRLKLPTDFLSVRRDYVGKRPWFDDASTLGSARDLAARRRRGAVSFATAVGCAGVGKGFAPDPVP